MYLYFLPLLISLFIHHICSFTYTKKCSVHRYIHRNKWSQVIWNVTFQDIDVSNKHSVLMQTKDFHSMDTYSSWNNLIKCTRYKDQPHSFTIVCEVDRNDYRARYNLRVVRTTTNTATDSSQQGPSYDVLVPPTSKGNYQNGVLCYPSHKLRNLRTKNITTNSAIVAWSFNEWDIKLIGKINIIVKLEGRPVVLRNIDMIDIWEESQEHVIGGLQRCRKYTVHVFYEYTFYDEKTEVVSFETACPSSGQKVGEVNLVVVVCAGCLLFFIVVVLLVWCVFCRRRRKTRKHYGDAVDSTDL